MVITLGTEVDTGHSMLHYFWC